jgi:hypothetical protein
MAYHDPLPHDDRIIAFRSLRGGGAWVDRSDGKKSSIDTKYFDAVNSPMTVNVESGKKNFFELKVDPSQ